MYGINNSLNHTSFLNTIMNYLLRLTANIYKKLTRKWKKKGEQNCNFTDKKLIHCKAFFLNNKRRERKYIFY